MDGLQSNDSELVENEVYDFNEQQSYTTKCY